jgi:hypothetical protein
MEQYQKEITELMEKLNPSTPPKIREKREQEATVHIDSIAQKLRKSHNYLTGLHTYGLLWRKMRRSNSWTNKRKKLTLQCRS